ncbi:MAG TPA: Wzz/FepE/Etk N-terminal domain-containing protein [Solirubrobacteraceae bacterium]|jgi:capsular polysaccharide biosynthesis protein
MEFAEILRILRARWIATLAVVVLAIAVAVAVRASVHSVPTGAATVQILVDSPDSALANLSQETVPLTTRASVFAQVMTSAAVLENIAKSAGVPVGEITAQGPYSGSGQSLDTVTPSEARGNQLLAEQTKYKLTFLAQTNEPVVTASVQAPSAAAAARVAASIYPGVQRYVTQLQQQSGTPAQHRVTIRQLGPPQSGPVNSSARSKLTAAALLGVLVLGLLGILGFEGLRRRAAERSELHREYLPEFDDVALYTRSLTAEEPDSPAAIGVGGSPAARRR